MAQYPLQPKSPKSPPQIPKVNNNNLIQSLARSIYEQKIAAYIPGGKFTEEVQERLWRESFQEATVSQQAYDKVSTEFLGGYKEKNA